MGLDDMIDGRSFLKPIPWPKVKKRINKQLERNARLVARFDSQQLRSISKIKSEELTQPTILEILQVMQL